MLNQRESQPCRTSPHEGGREAEAVALKKGERDARILNSHPPSGPQIRRVGSSGSCRAMDHVFIHITSVDGMI